jgi:hypothetical protein
MNLYEVPTNRSTVQTRFLRETHMRLARRQGQVKNLRLTHVAVALLIAVLDPAGTRVQSDSSNQNVNELRKQANELCQQLSQLQTRLGELEGRRPTEAAVPPAAPSTNQEGTVQSTQAPAQAAPSPQVGQATGTYTTFTEDSVAAARFNNVPLDPKYKGFFRLPGTQTLLKIDRYFKTDGAIYSYAAVNNTSFFAAATPATYNHAAYTSANLIWNSFGSFNVGAEFLYGWAMEQSGLKANAPRIQFNAEYSFVKVDADC